MVVQKMRGSCVTQIVDPQAWQAGPLEAPVKRERQVRHVPWASGRAREDEVVLLPLLSRVLSLSIQLFAMRSEDRDGKQDSTVSVFTKDADGTLRHFYSSHPSMAEDINQRGIDLLSPV